MNHAGLQPPYRPRQVSYIGERGAGHLQRNPRGERQSAGDSQQNSPRAQVQSGGKFKEFLAPFIAATDKNRDG
jgi:hypothetical protein